MSQLIQSSDYCVPKKGWAGFIKAECASKMIGTVSEASEGTGWLTIVSQGQRAERTLNVEGP